VGALNPVQSTTPAGRTNVVIKQTAQQAMLDWETFNVGRETTVRFDQSAAGGSASQWIAFNRITDPSGAPSQVLGNIEAQGQVYVLNPNGVLFGATSQVNLHTLTVSSLPINQNLVDRGLLNNPDSEFLFNAPAPAAGRFGDITVEAGAQIASPVSADGNGGRILLAAPNVTNAGTLSTPAGQTILAAGLQVGVQAHRTDDPGLRGLDVYVGTIGTYGGKVTNTGLIEVPRGNAWLAGANIAHTGVIDSSTSVALNGRIELHASYDAVPNTGYDPAVITTGTPFLFKSTGSVELGAGSVLRVRPDEVHLHQRWWAGVF
jgi:filamentous hemagglutinin family protein